MQEQSLLGVILTSKSIPESVSNSHILPSDFWQSLKPAEFNKTPYDHNHPFELSHDSHLGLLNVRTKSSILSGKPIYHILITNNEVHASRKSSQHAALDNPDYLVSERTFEDFNQALSMHHASLYRLYELGF